MRSASLHFQNPSPQAIVDETDRRDQHTVAAMEDLEEGSTLPRMYRPPSRPRENSLNRYFWKAFRTIIIGFSVVTLIYLIFRLVVRNA